MSNIKNQMGSAVNKINEKNPSFLLAGIFTVILVVFYLFPLQFQLKTLQAINPKLEELNRETTETRNNILRVTQYKKELSRLEEKYQNLQRRIKRKEDIPFLLENISRIADKHGVKIEQILPQTAINDPVLENNEGKYFSIPIVIEAESGYHPFGRFLNEMERDGIFLRLPNFSIETGREDQQTASINLAIELVVFEGGQK
ncbi:MAG TPA: type 4a pilus biogenesis protein PilO [Candidatus Omnitrophota bacterium]|nr:type 4a pilus biogenesis protein PilO [Candidatus Omnitrophota bacterium]HQO57101.1 type 4a pilus biogenesis protein PilO [Candidatus Omnitrophota bacterium]HQP11219.1 type 4a pilus biogenesis protein PilO [Candidatus Omnitrophota bacterium]